LTNRKIGILGGGQLGKMICQAGSKLSMDISCLDPADNPPAALVCTKIVRGDFNNIEDVLAFGNDKDIITIEIENVNTEALKRLEEMGKKVYPQAKVIELIKDKGLQKQFYQTNQIPSSKFNLYHGKEHILEDIAKGELVFPFVQKLRTGGYDGRGVQLVKSEDDIEKLFDAPSVIEDMVPIQKELSVIVARSIDGSVKSFPVVEMEFSAEANLVEFLFCPAKISEELAVKSRQIAEKIAKELKIVGLLAVELFLDRAGQILVNEVAPRTHNSGHHTIEACATSQFEQQLRAISGYPLGSTEINGAAVMINLLGEADHQGPAVYKGLSDSLKVDYVYPHIYGKELTKPFRKMGHITVTGSVLDEVIVKARNIKDLIKVIT